MKRPLPELVQHRPSPAAWQVAPTCHAAHDRTATPHRRRIAGQPSSEHIEAARIEHDRITSLIASRYNTKRPATLGDLLKHHAGTMLTDDEAQTLAYAAEELRNRALTLDTPTGQRTPPRRYHLPEQLAAHHADPSSKRPAALDLAAIAHHADDLATYLQHLKAHDRPTVAYYAEHTTDAIRAALDELRHDLKTNPRRRYNNSIYNRTAHKWQTIRATPAEHAAFQIGQHLATFAAWRSRHAQQDQRHAKTKQQERRRLELETGHRIPPDLDELTGWLPLNISKPPREIAHLGRLGRKRSTSDTGKTPNRIANYCGDPLRRIYSRKTRGTNALVIVDCSGSMSLTERDLDAILKASTGATVVAYSGSNHDDPNTYLVAHNQRRVRYLPEFDGGNGIDAPAALWAIKTYRKKSAPVLWITDGGATGATGSGGRGLRAQCRKVAQKYGATIAPDVQTALADLAAIRAGHRPPQRLHTFQQ